MQIQGHQIDKLKGRFSGTVDDVDEEHFKFDRMVVMLVIGRCSIGSVDVKDDGEVHAVMKIKVEDITPLEEELRDQAIAYLAHGAGQGILDFGNYRHQGEPKPAKEGQESLPVATYAEPPEADENGERVTATASTPARVLQDEEFDVPPGDPLPVTARPGDVDPPAVRAPVEEPTALGADEAPAPSGTVVGSLRRGERKDAVLDAWLSGE